MRLKDMAQVAAAQVPLCPLPLVEMETRWAVKEFLKESRAWTALVKGKWSACGEGCRMDWPDGTAPALVYEVRVNGRELAPIAGAGEMWPTSAVASQAGPTMWRFRNGKIELFPMQETRQGEVQDYEVEALAVLTIEGRNPDIPDWIDPYEISYGAMGKLFGMAGQPWSNAALGVAFEEKFGRAIAGKRIERMHGGRPGSLTMQTPFVGGYF